MPSPIIARADALMQRRHQGSGESEEIPILTDAIDEEENIPLLVDIAPESDPADPGEADPSPAGTLAPQYSAPHSTLLDCAPPPAETRAPSAIDPAWREQLVNELAERVRQRLADEIPRLIASTVHDFLAEQEMIDRHPGD